MKYSLIFTILLCLGQCVCAQDTIPTVVVEPASEEDYYEEQFFEEDYEIDNSRNTVVLLENSELLNDSLQERKLEDGFQQKYDGRDFDYSLTKPKESLWSKIERALAEFFSKIFRTGDVKAVNTFTVWVLRILSIGIIGLVIYWLVKYFLANQGFGLLAKKDKVINPEARTIKENIHEIDFNDLIQSYELSKDFRFAVRYQYLHLLKILNDKHLLEWDPEKTNLDYVNELKNKEIQKDFSGLTHVFDYVWYGEFTVDEESYRKIKSQFTSLKQKV